MKIPGNLSMTMTPNDKLCLGQSQSPVVEVGLKLITHQRCKTLKELLSLQQNITTTPDKVQELALKLCNL